MPKGKKYEFFLCGKSENVGFSKNAGFLTTLHHLNSYSKSYLLTITSPRLSKMREKWGKKVRKVGFLMVYLEKVRVRKEDEDGGIKTR